MNKDRLLKLAAHLRTVASETFNLGYWRCGTVACAVGHACAIPEFRAAGLHLGVNDFGGLIPEYQHWCNWGAVREFFTLSGGQADYLFYYSEYDPACATANHVADRIEQFVRGEE